MHSVYVIYKDGEPMKGHASGIKRNAFDKKGSAKSIITGLVNDHANYALGLYRYDNPERYDEALEKERKRYEIVEYTPKRG